MRSAELYCEGFHDRAFLAGWLLSRGWVDPGRKDGRRGPVVNPTSGKTVVGGRFGFVSPNGELFLEVVPTSGYPQIRADLRRRISELATRPLDELVVVVDLDSESATPTSDELRARREALLAVWQPRSTLLGGERTRFDVVVWCLAGPRRSGVPAKQTLERIVCAALADAYPVRAECVERWLASRPAASPLGPKNYSWSYMAGWDAERGSEDFLRSVWDDAALRPLLDAAMATCGANALAERLERPAA